jgi:hypothetical protein
MASKHSMRGSLTSLDPVEPAPEVTIELLPQYSRASNGKKTLSRVVSSVRVHWLGTGQWPSKPRVQVLRERSVAELTNVGGTFVGDATKTEIKAEILLRVERELRRLHIVPSRVRVSWVKAISSMPSSLSIG